MLFKEALENVASSITVSLAADGQKLINSLNTLSIPDMIFLDLNMPRKNGLECLREIRSDDKFDHIPVIMYSTSQSKKDIEACYEGGANLYVVKPYTFEDIIAMLKSLLTHFSETRKSQIEREQFVLTA